MKRPFLRHVLPLLCLAVPVAVTAACGEDFPTPDAKDASVLPEAGALPEPYKVTVRRTTVGVPHVKADDFGSLGYGYGYVFAEDNLCILAEEILTVRGERAKYFGDVPYDLGNTGSESNVNSDAFYRLEFTKEVVDRYRETQPEELRAMVRGYAAGVSRYVRELKEGKHPGRHAACAAEPWVREIDDEDLFLRYYKLNLLGSGATFIDGVAAAKPPASPSIAPPGGKAMAKAPSGAARIPSVAEVRAGLQKVAPKLMAQRQGELGSNMYAFGSETTGGGGIQFGNPHFPWFGGERLYQVHLTVPGKMDVQGASLYGAPIVLIGFTDTFAWSHTTSTAYRFTPYMLTLKPGDPFTYIKDGQEKKITSHPIEVEVKQQDGSVTKTTVTLYRSEYGPMLYLGNPLFAWTNERAFTYRDANAENLRLFRHYFRWNTAKSLDEFKKIHAEEVAVPWVNTTAADKDGNAYYADITVVPNVPDEMVLPCGGGSIPAKALAGAAPGLPLLDGSKSECDWKIDADSPQPGTFGASHLPKLERKDYVVNCNDSYWLTNPTAPITGYASIIGRIGYEQTLRTRLCHQQVLDRLAGTDGLANGAAGQKVTAENVKQMVVGSRVYSAERFLQQVLDAYCQAPADADATAACTALTAWDKTNDPAAKGSVVWDEFWLRIVALQRTTVVFDTPFAPADPLNTPAGLKTTEPKVAEAFAAAVKSVKDAGFAFDAPRSAVSWFAGKGGKRIPVPGGFQSTGNFTIAQVPGPALKADVGYSPLTYGNSYMQVVAFGPTGVDASTFVTYSLSIDPASPHFDDYTQLYSEKKWLKAAFTEAEVAADTKSTIVLEQ